MCDLTEQKCEINKTLQDIIDKDILSQMANIHWSELSENKRQKKILVYNKILLNNWGVDKEIKWSNNYSELNELQKRLLLKKELINAYNILSESDRVIVNEYCNIQKDKRIWINLSENERQSLFRAIFNIY